jgi:hypothetical protein
MFMLHLFFYAYKSRIILTYLHNIKNVIKCNRNVMKMLIKHKKRYENKIN